MPDGPLSTAAIRLRHIPSGRAGQARALVADDPPLVLIVEDEALLALTLQAELEDAGFNTAMAATAADVAEVLQAEIPAAAIVDLRLRDGLTGPKIAETLIDLDVLVVVCSGEPADSVVHLPVLAHVQKPSSPDVLLDIIRGATLPDHQR